MFHLDKRNIRKYLGIFFNVESLQLNLATKLVTTIENIGSSVVVCYGMTMEVCITFVLLCWHMVKSISKSYRIKLTCLIISRIPLVSIGNHERIICLDSDVTFSCHLYRRWKLSTLPFDINKFKVASLSLAVPRKRSFWT